MVKAGRYGPYVATVPAEGSKDKPRTASLFKDMSVDTIELDDALRLLSLPRVVGLAEDGEPITAQNGRYGPYVTHGKESRSLASEEELFTVDLPAALALLAQPKARGRAAAAPPLRTLGNDAVSGAADGGQGGPLRRLRDRRRDQREPAQGRRGRGAHRRPCRRAARRPAGPRSGEEGRPRLRQEGSGEEGSGQDGERRSRRPQPRSRRPRRPRRRRHPPSGHAAKKA